MPESIEFDARMTQILRMAPGVGAHFIGGTVSTEGRLTFAKFKGPRGIFTVLVTATVDISEPEQVAAEIIRQAAIRLESPDA